MHRRTIWRAVHGCCMGARTPVLVLCSAACCAGQPPRPWALPRRVPLQKLTSTQDVADNGITWVEQLSLEVLEGASELRIMLCRPKQAGSERSSSSIVAACGIYMKVGGGGGGLGRPHGLGDWGTAL